MPGIAGDAPDLKRTEFGHSSFEPHGYNSALLAIEVERDLQRAQFLDVASPVFQRDCQRGPVCEWWS